MQRHRAARLCGKFPLFDRRQRSGGTAYTGPLRLADEGLHHHARRASDRARRRFAGRSRVSDGIVPHFNERGEGDTALVFLHGVGGGKEIWQPQLDFFAAEGYRAVAWDMPGYGASPMLPHYSFATFAAALAQVLDKLRAARVVLIGHSMGGMVALEAAARYPHRLAGLVLACTSPAFGKKENAWQQAFIRARTRPLDEGKTMLDLARALMPTLLGLQPDPHARKLAIGVMSRVPPNTYRAALAALVNFDRRDALPNIHVPTLT